MKYPESVPIHTTTRPTTSPSILRSQRPSNANHGKTADDGKHACEVCEIDMAKCLCLSQLYETNKSSSKVNNACSKDVLATCKSGSYCYQNSCQLCPRGYYCPFPESKIECNSHHYCSAGCISPRHCHFSYLSCALPGMDMPDLRPVLINLIIIGFFVYFGVRFSIPIIQHYVVTDRRALMLRKYHSTRYVDIRLQQRELKRRLSTVSSNDDIDSPRSQLNSIWQLRSGNDSAMMSNNVSSKSAIDALDEKIDETINPLHDIEVELKRNDNSSHFRPTYDVSFKSVSLFLKSNNSRILDSISGKISSFRVTALLGPSGAGKTSLLALLRGKAFYARTEGKILVNGVEVNNLQSFCNMMSFVPQSDVMYDELTVQDNVVYSALLFNRRGYTTIKEVLPMVTRALSMLTIQFIATSVVGNDETRGVSGGQKKRVSVAMAMMKEPSMLFLDEPTSGLDAGASMSLIQCLRNMAAEGVTVVSTLHQPRREIIDLIDDIVLLASGGHLVYIGAVSELDQYFSSIGYTCPLRTNISDFIIDVVSGFIAMDQSESLDDIDVVNSYLIEKWTAYHIHEEYDVKDEEHTIIPISTSTTFTQQLYRRLFEFKVIVQRQFLIFLGTNSVFRGDCIVLFAMGGLIASLFGTAIFQSFDDARRLPPITTAMQLTFSLIILSPGCRFFGNDVLMRWREEEGGILFLPYFLGKFLASFMECLVFPAVFSFSYVFLLVSSTTFSNYWSLLCLLQLSIYSIANAVTLIVPAKSRVIVSNGIVIVSWAIGGLDPSMDTINHRLGTFGVILNALSPFRWSFELQIINECNGYPPVFNEVTERALTNMKYHRNNGPLCKGMLILHCFLWNLIAILWLMASKDHFKIFRPIQAFATTLAGKIRKSVCPALK